MKSQFEEEISMANHLADYVEVNVRIQKFWEKYPNGRIQTEVFKWTDDGVIGMKAYVYRDVTDEKPFAEGTAYEKEGSSQVNRTSALENCETSAVGRALGNGGFEIKKSIASKDEVENAIHQQEQKPSGDDAKIQAHKKAINQAIRKVNMSREAFNEILSALDIPDYAQITLEQLQKLSQTVATYQAKEDTH